MEKREQGLQISNNTCYILCNIYLTVVILNLIFKLLMTMILIPQVGRHMVNSKKEKR